MSSDHIVDHPSRKEFLEQLENLKKGGGGGTFEGMEARIAQLEKDVSELKSDSKTIISSIGELKGDNGELRGKISMLPGYPGIAVIMTIVGGALLVVSRLFPAGTP